MDTPKSTGVSRFGRKRKLTDEYKAVTGKMSHNFSLFSTPLLKSINLGRTRKSTKILAAESSDNSSDASNPPKKSSRKQTIPRKLQTPRKNQRSKRRGFKREIKEELKAVEEEDEYDETGDTDDGIDELISEQLLKMPDEPDMNLNLLKATIADDFLDPENFRPAQMYNTIRFKVPDMERLVLYDA